MRFAKHLSKGTPVLIGDGEKTGGLEAPDQGSQQLAGTEEPPLPERSPVTDGTEQMPIAPGQRTTIPWTETEIAEAKTKCNEALSTLTLNYEPLPPIKEGLCGAPAPILLKSLGRDPEVALDPPATVTCALAKALSTWLNESVQPQAKALFKSSVTKLHVGSYTCRNRNGGADTPLSEHALANALDISDFILVSGERIAVVESWPSNNPPLPMPNPDRVSSTSSVKRVSVSLEEWPLRRPRRLAVRRIPDVHEASCGNVYHHGYLFGRPRRRARSLHRRSHEKDGRDDRQDDRRGKEEGGYNASRDVKGRNEKGNHGWVHDAYERGSQSDGNVAEVRP